MEIHGGSVNRGFASPEGERGCKGGFKRGFASPEGERGCKGGFKRGFFSTLGGDRGREIRNQGMPLI